ncbi:cysteine-rich receptor-like protein kinase 10 [Triticum urartu]|uniref:Gnk2-homologous domain-containing protein n=1 Tax=Triticum urartu TaxID=4572 RepID=A0A8R7TSK0_TRIUA|nr:cysteine-rich receptor-like protein kinase 10 [Triticum urartu]
MALPAISWPLISLLLAVTPAHSTCEESVRIAGAGGLLQCYPAPALSNATNGTAFRATLLPLLRSLPSAAAPTGFASLRSVTRGERAFARGLCFGNSTVPSECARCLSAAAGNLTAGCGSTSQRAGFWSDRCFLAYADTNTSSPSEDAFRALVLLDAVPASKVNTKSFYYVHLHDELVAMAQQVARRAAANISGPRMLATAEESNSESAVSRTVHVLAQCGRDRTAAGCVRCLQNSVHAVDWDLNAARVDGGVAAAVVGFNCYMRFEVSTAACGDTIWGAVAPVLLVLSMLAGGACGCMCALP